jgi:uncharacterized protein YjiS (DUF1127 family)
MAYIAHVPASVEVAHGWLSRAAAVVRHGWQAYWRRRAQRATVALLQSLDQHALHDLGIDRSEIESVVYGVPVERRQRYCWTRP